MTSLRPTDAEPPLTSEQELVRLFHESEKPASSFRIGAEAEKFGVDSATGAPLAYDGRNGVLRVMSGLTERYGWRPYSEYEGGPVIALERGAASVTLEPGGQLELSGAPLATIHEIEAESAAHLEELREISSEMNVAWLGIGFHPFARQQDLPWVPKQRYAVMREYLPPRGLGALDMMRRTATVQANFDYSDEEDAMRKVQVALRLSPLIQAMTACSPFCESRTSALKSLRGNVWLNMDPQRSGLLPALWSDGPLRYSDYVEWALDAGMFLFKRGDQVIANSGQTFRSFLRDGFQGHRATWTDWKTHLNTLFPEVRLKSTIEVRACDALPRPLMSAVPALFTGFLYDSTALAQAEELARTFSYDQVMQARPDLVRYGLAATLSSRAARDVAATLLEIAAGGLARRQRRNEAGEDEGIYLQPLADLVARGACPADELTRDLPGGVEFRREVIRRTALLA
jgi:glutamate--cysteine ligase